MAEQVQLDDTVTEPGQLGNAIDNEEMVEQLDSTIDRDPLKPLVWEDSLTRLLIDYYRENPCLYDVASKEYLDRDLKRKVVEGIAMKLGTNSELIMMSFIHSQHCGHLAIIFSTVGHSFSLVLTLFYLDNRMCSYCRSPTFADLVFILILRYSLFILYARFKVLIMRSIFTVLTHS